MKGCVYELRSEEGYEKSKDDWYFVESSSIFWNFFINGIVTLGKSMENDECKRFSITEKGRKFLEKNSSR